MTDLVLSAQNMRDDKMVPLDASGPISQFLNPIRLLLHYGMASSETSSQDVIMAGYVAICTGDAFKTKVSTSYLFDFQFSKIRLSLGRLTKFHCK